MPYDIPTFGHEDPAWDYIDRPGAYALIVRDEDNKVLIVDENSGWFLPGGGLEEGETPTEALHREVLEETGHEIDEPEELTRVCQYIISQTEQTAYAKDCHIFRTRLGERTEPADCDLLWVAPAQAVEKLAHECFRWVVEQYVSDL